MDSRWREMDRRIKGSLLVVRDGLYPMVTQGTFNINEAKGWL
jgi:hypothetical protein